MLKHTFLLLAMAVLASAPLAAPKLLWETKGLAAPESVVYDSKRDRLLVSNINGAPDAKDGNGFISVVDTTGKIRNLHWVEGLDAPKGLALYGDRLYIADLQSLVVADLETGEVVGRYPGENAKFFNDVAVDAQGNVYVSDQQGFSIHRLSAGQFKPWLVADKHTLCSPNGLLAEASRLLVGCWTYMIDEFDDNVAGHLRAVSYADKSISDLGDGSPQGYLDGVESDGAGGYLVTDWVAGRLLAIDAAGGVSEILTLENGSADHAVVTESGMVYIPMMNNDTLRAYRLD